MEVLPTPDFELNIADPKAFFGTQARLLESLFKKPDWIPTTGRSLNHPAYERWAYCHVLGQHGINALDLARNALLAGQILGDAVVLARASGGKTAGFSLGDFSNYGKANVLKRIQKEIERPEHFFSRIAEITAAAWLIAQGFSAIPSEDAGEPDLFITKSADFDAYYVEVKSTPTAITDNAVLNHLRTANIQLGRKKMMSAKGFVVLDVSPKLSEQVDFSRHPEDILRIAKVIDWKFYEDHDGAPHVGAVVLSWRDFVLTIHSRRYLRFTSIFHLRRNALVIRNTKAARPILERLPMEEYGDGVQFEIGWMDGSFKRYSFNAGFPA